MSARDRAFEEWVERGRSVRIVEALRQTGHFARLKRSGGELVGPCPLCGGADRFGVNPAKDIWNCRRCGVGGDAIRLVRHVEGLGFVDAIERLSGEAPPGGAAQESEAERAARRTRQEAVLAAAEEADARKAAEQADYRQRERARMHEVWLKARPIGGTIVEDYLRLRGVVAPPDAHLRYLPHHALWDAPPPGGKIVHRGPAMVAAIVGPDGKFAGLHATWIDLADPDGKARVPDPTTGELIPAKKVRGSKKGGSILLGRPASGQARIAIYGEGIETVLSVRRALIATGAPMLAKTEFRSGVDLGNLAGRAKGRVAHPTQTTVDNLGRVRRVMMANAAPHPDDRSAVVSIGAAIEHVVLLGDGDSEPFSTRLALERAAMRLALAYPWISVGLAMAPEGMDFNDLWRRANSDAARAGGLDSAQATTIAGDAADQATGAL